MNCNSGEAYSHLAWMSYAVYCARNEWRKIFCTFCASSKYFLSLDSENFAGAKFFWKKKRERKFIILQRNEKLMSECKKKKFSLSTSIYSGNFFILIQGEWMNDRQTKEEEEWKHFQRNNDDAFKLNEGRESSALFIIFHRFTIFYSLLRTILQCIILHTAFLVLILLRNKMKNCIIFLCRFKKIGINLSWLTFWFWHDHKKLAFLQVPSWYNRNCIWYFSSLFSLSSPNCPTYRASKIITKSLEAKRNYPIVISAVSKTFFFRLHSHNTKAAWYRTISDQR